MYKSVGETGANCKKIQLKSLFVKSMIDALFLSTHTLNSLFVLIKHAIPLIFLIVVRQKREVSQTQPTVTTSPVSGASCHISYGALCYNKERVDRKVQPGLYEVMPLLRRGDTITSNQIVPCKRRCDVASLAMRRSDVACNRNVPSFEARRLVASDLSNHRQHM